MKLAIITPGFQPVPATKGGAIEQLITYTIMANERSHDFDIDLYTVYDKKFDSCNYNYTKILSYKKKWYDFPLRVFSLFLRTAGKVFRKETSFNYISFHMGRLYKKDYYDVVLVENNMDVYATILKKITREKLYFHLHNDFDNGDFAKTKHKTQKIIETSDGIITVSHFLENKLKSYGAKKVTVVYNFVPNRFLGSLSNEQQLKIRSNFNFKDNDIIFTYIGRLDRDKGADQFLEAFDKIRKYDKKIKGLVVGDAFFHTKVEQKYFEKITELRAKLKNRVKFIGYVPNQELINLYSISDCIVIPSQVEEAFGLVALEAMKMKKPVIASNSGALPEVLAKDGAIIVNKESNFVPNLANSIEALSKNAQLRRKMGISNFNKSKTFPQSEFEYFSLIKKAIKVNN